MTARLDLGTCALGRALDAAGVPLDGGPAPRGRRVCVELRAPRPNERSAIERPLWTGVRAIDGLLTIGRGARVGIFGAPGCGKTTLLETIVQECAAESVVVALCGERGREAQAWIARRDERSTLICATSDRPASERVAAAHVAFAQARALRERGLHVLLVLDSLARVAGALREIAVAKGESTGRAGYPPSVFAELARLVEIAGALERGSITLIATVLSDGDERDPVSDAARSLLDGHIALSPKLAQAGRFPAIDVVQSTSRTMDVVVGDAQRGAARAARHALALLDASADARALGFAPADEATRAAVAAETALEAFLRQARGFADPRESVARLLGLRALLAAHADR